MSATSDLSAGTASTAIPVTRDIFREGMARMGHAVNIITSDGPFGRLGFTATAVCSLSDNPASLLVCMNRSSLQNDPLKKNNVLCVNTLSSAQQDLSVVFSGVGKLDMPERFGRAEWDSLATGSPVLRGAIASFDCRINMIIEVGTHSLILADVVDMTLGETAPSLIYLHRKYRNLHHTEDAAAPR